MAEKIHVEITAQPLDIADAHKFVADPAHGAIDTFTGMVRQTNLGRNVLGVSYDVYEPLAEKMLRGICENVAKEHEGRINIYLAHYKGRLDVGGVSVIIAVSTSHRKESFDACRALIEALKHNAPIWKQEHYTDGDSEWVKGHALCAHAS